MNAPLKISLASLALICAINIKAGAANLEIDRSSSRIEFELKHMMMMTAHGQFKEFTGSIEKDPADFTNSKVSLKVQVKSVDTESEKRDDHLRTADFFDVAQYPEATFTSTKIEKISEKKFKLHGDLSLHGKTKSVVFDLSEDSQEGTRTLYTAHLELNRLDWGVGQSSMMIGDQVKLKVKLATIVAGPAAAQK